MPETLIKEPETGVTGFLCERQNTESLYNTTKRFCGLTFDLKKNVSLFSRKRVEENFDKRKVIE